MRKLPSKVVKLEIPVCNEPPFCRQAVLSMLLSIVHDNGDGIGAHSHYWRHFTFSINAHSPFPIFTLFPRNRFINSQKASHQYGEATTDKNGEVTMQSLPIANSKSPCRPSDCCKYPISIFLCCQSLAPALKCSSWGVKHFSHFFPILQQQIG